MRGIGYCESLGAEVEDVDLACFGGESHSVAVWTLHMPTHTAHPHNQDLSMVVTMGHNGWRSMKVVLGRRDAKGAYMTTSHSKLTPTTG